jgi:hypothetical protein
VSFSLHLQGEVSGDWIGVQVMISWVMIPCGGVVGYNVPEGLAASKSPCIMPSHAILW